MLTDGELLRRYAEEGSQAAFTELVQRHINVVYHAALRRVGGNAHSADDVTQRVFTDLARKAKSLRDRPSLAGWLHTGTRFAAAEVVRAERRRRTHEEEAHAMRECEPDPQVPVEHLNPFLDEVLDHLEERDREAVLLHFFEGRTFSEVGAVLSLSADAVRMRVNRALGRLRADLGKRGIGSSEEALASSLAAQATLSVAAPLALEIASRVFKLAKLPGPGSSALRRPWRAVKSSPATPWLGGAAAVVAISGAFLALSHPAGLKVQPPIRLEAPASEPATAATRALSHGGPVEASIAVDQGAGASKSGAHNGIARFSDLSPPEQRILALLWSHNHGIGYQGKGWIAIRPDPNGQHPYEGFDNGRELLISKGLARFAPINGGVRLTPAGWVFCLDHQAEIEAYSVSIDPSPSGKPQ